jgi:hypothetical protein
MCSDYISVTAVWQNANVKNYLPFVDVQVLQNTSTFLLLCRIIGPLNARFDAHIRRMAIKVSAIFLQKRFENRSV